MTTQVNAQDRSQITVTLPDGSKKSFSSPSTVHDVAASIGPGLAKSTIAGEVNGVLVDACDLVTEDATVRIITARDAEGLEIIRHSCAHLLGHAVKQLYPTAQMVIGPVIVNGFYYDIAYERNFTADDLVAIEERMKKLISTHYDVIKEVTPRARVIETFEARGKATNCNSSQTCLMRKVWVCIITKNILICVADHMYLTHGFWSI